MRLAVSLDGSDVDRDREAFATAAVPADAIRSVDSGNTADRLANRSGVVGADVVGITVHPVAGGDVPATIRDGTAAAARSHGTPASHPGGPSRRTPDAADFTASR